MQKDTTQLNYLNLTNDLIETGKPRGFFSKFVQKYLVSNDVTSNLFILNQLMRSDYFAGSCRYDLSEDTKSQDILKSFITKTINSLDEVSLAAVTSNFDYKTNSYIITRHFVENYKDMSNETKNLFFSNIVVYINKEVVLAEKDQDILFKMLNLDGAQEYKDIKNYNSYNGIRDLIRDLEQRKSEIICSLEKEEWLQIFNKFNDAEKYFAPQFAQLLYYKGVLGFKNKYVQKSIIDNLVNEEFLSFLNLAIANDDISKDEYFNILDSKIKEENNKPSHRENLAEKYFVNFIFDYQIKLLKDSKNLYELEQIILSNYTKDEQIILSETVKSLLKLNPKKKYESISLEELNCAIEIALKDHDCNSQTFYRKGDIKHITKLLSM